MGASFEATDEDRDILGMWLRKDHKPDSIERAIIGLRAAVEAEALVPFLNPGDDVGVAVPVKAKWGGRRIWAIAEEAYFRSAA